MSKTTLPLPPPKGGGNDRLSPPEGEGNDRAARRYECGVCWEVYDPALGDPVWQVPPGTPFEALPAHWSCPVCAAERDRFLELVDE